MCMQIIGTDQKLLCYLSVFIVHTSKFIPLNSQFKSSNSGKQQANPLSFIYIHYIFSTVTE